MEIRSSEPIPRAAGRVLVINPDGRVLMLQGFDPADPERRYWFTVGGGLDEGERSADAAARELREEAGIPATAADLVGPIWERYHEFSFDGVSYAQHEDYFVVGALTAAATATSTATDSARRPRRLMGAWPHVMDAVARSALKSGRSAVGPRPYRHGTREHAVWQPLDAAHLAQAVAAATTPQARFYVILAAVHAARPGAIRALRLD